MRSVAELNYCAEKQRLRSIRMYNDIALFGSSLLV